MRNPLANIFTKSIFYYCIGAIVILFALSFRFSILFPISQAVLIFFVALCLADFMLLYINRNPISCVRKIPPILSLHDENNIYLKLDHTGYINYKVSIIDELPFQLQKRDFNLKIRLERSTYKELEYQIKPFKRGKYLFRNTNIFISSFLGILERRILFIHSEMSAVYPSIIQMKKYELRTLKQIAFFQGVKKMRRIGHSYEFDQIKKYVHGDDIRNINWKATGRAGELMVNHFEEEKAQQIFCIIDKSRTMKMPFDQLSLLDYSINTSLVISNIALKKEDKVGLITFSDKIGTTLAADKNKNHLKKILDALHLEKERFLEANFELLYMQLRKIIKVRSLLFLFTNFESFYAIERVVNILRRLNKMHLLVVIFFENEEMIQFSKSDPGNIEQIYLTTIAQKFVIEKKMIQQELEKYGIQTIITTPANLSINTINKYLELKARGAI